MNSETVDMAQYMNLYALEVLEYDVHKGVLMPIRTRIPHTAKHCSIARKSISMVYVSQAIFHGTNT